MKQIQGREWKWQMDALATRWAAQADAAGGAGPGADPLVQAFAEGLHALPRWVRRTIALTYREAGSIAQKAERSGLARQKFYAELDLALAALCGWVEGHCQVNFGATIEPMPTGHALPPAQPPAPRPLPAADGPCPGCRRQPHCAAEQLACTAFDLFTRGHRWQIAPRADASHARWEQIFPASGPAAPPAIGRASELLLVALKQLAEAG